MEPMAPKPIYRAVIVRLPFDLRDTHYYQMCSLHECNDVLFNETFASLMLDMVKEPILALASIFDELMTYKQQGMLKYLVEVDAIDENELARSAGKEMSDLIDHVCDIFKSNPDDIQHYNHAMLIKNGLVLLYVTRLEEADALTIT